MSRKINGIVGLIVLFFAAWIGVQCRTPEGSGSAMIGVRSTALSLDDIDHIIVTVSGPNIAPDIVVNLSGDPINGWSGLIQDIPAGDDRTFLAQAYDIASTVIYSGEVTGVTINDGETIQVIIYLQQETPPDPFTNAVPRFDSLVISDSQIAPLSDVSISVSAVDPDNDPLVYSWSAGAGSFSDSASQSTVWTAPAVEGLVELTVTATDPASAAATISFNIDVQVQYGSGNADVLLYINTWPEVYGLVPTPARIDVGETTMLDLTVFDPDGDSLSYAWAADCVGTFSDVAAEDPSFTLDGDNGGLDCNLSVTITDGQGGINTADLFLATGGLQIGCDPDPCIHGTCVENGVSIECNCDTGWTGLLCDSPVAPAGCEGAIVFPDENLENIIRNEIGKPNGDIYYSDVNELQWLDAMGENLSDISGLQCLTALTELVVSDNQLIDISPLAGLTSLVYLEAASNSIDDISALSGLVALTEADLGFNEISDLSPLSGLPSLEYLFVEHNQLSNANGLSGLPVLEHVSLDYNQIDDIDALSDLPSLTSIDIENNQISDIGALTSIPSLMQVYMGFNQISDISALAGLNALTNLGIRDNQVMDIGALSGLTNLAELDLQNNQIADVNALAGLSGVYSLQLRSNQIVDISALASMSSLQYLYLEYNQIIDISPLVNNVGLTGPNDIVWLNCNPLINQEDNIQALIDLGVTIQNTCE